MIEDVVTNVRDAFLDEGVDEQVLQEMKQIWTNRLMASKAVEVIPEPQAPNSQPALLANNPKVSRVFVNKRKAEANCLILITRRHLGILTVEGICLLSKAVEIILDFVGL